MKKSLIFIIITLILLLCSCNGGTTAEPPAPLAPENSEKEINVMVYFASEDSMYLIPEQREIIYEKEEEIPLKIIETIIEGPVTENLFPAINKETEIKEVTVKNRIAEVVVGDNFISLNAGGSTKEFMALQSITNSLVELSGIDSVRFKNPDGQIMEEFGSFALDLPLTKDTSIAD